MIHIPRHYCIEELVPKSLYEAHRHEKPKLWLCFDSRMLWTADALRMRFGKMVANTWNQGGPYQYRGFRPWDASVGSPFSQHKFGRAADLDPEEISAEEIRSDILAHPDRDEYKFIRCLEEGVAWLHFDVRSWLGPILVVKP